MKTNDKLIKLLEHGFNGELLSELNEGQINTLYKKLSESKKETKEETKTQVTNFTFDPTNVGDQQKLAQRGFHVDPNTKKITITTSPTGAITEDDLENDDVSLALGAKGNDDMALALSNMELTEKFESKSQQKYFWAKCDKSTGKEKKKWCDLAKEFSKLTTKKDYKKMPEKLHPEKTVQYKKKKDTNESYLDMVGKAFNNNMKNKITDIQPSLNWTESEIEKGIMKLLEKHITPKMTKKEFLSLVSEQGQPTIAPPKPGTKPTTRPNTPYQPKPGPKKSPKAGRNEMPNWLSFKSIGIKLK